MTIRRFPDFERQIYDIAGLPFDAVHMQQAIQKVLNASVSREPLFISTPNLNFLIAAQSDPMFRDSVRHSDLSLADGMPVIWLARMLRVPVRERVAGSDLFEALTAQSDATIKVFFFGGPDGAAQQAAEVLNQLAQEKQQRQQRAGVICVGYESPGYVSLDELSRPELIERINRANADFIVVALGARKGQAWIERNRAHLDAPVISHLGAVVNMAAGTISRAPHWMQKVGLEWIWRIKEEPQLWRRYASDGIALVRLISSQILPTIWKDLRFRMGGSGAAGAAHVEIHRANGQSELRLSGAWTASDVPLLRKHLQQCCSGEDQVRVDASRATHLDPAILGLLALV